MIKRISDIRNDFINLWNSESARVSDKGGGDVIEIIGASFLADESSIFGAVDNGYISRELEWYSSQSLCVDDIPGGAPKIWSAVASKDRMINSNYGYLVFNEANYNQLQAVARELIRDSSSRRAVTIYTRPTMHEEATANGMSDFICTNTVQYLIRDGACHAIVQMRSNDAWAGYRNDIAWQKYVLQYLVDMLTFQSQHTNLRVGNIIWQVGSLHIYSRQYYLLDAYVKSGGRHDITHKEYKETYGCTKI